MAPQRALSALNIGPLFISLHHLCQLSLAEVLFGYRLSCPVVLPMCSGLSRSRLHVRSDRICLRDGVCHSSLSSPRVMAGVQDESELTAEHLAGGVPDLSFHASLGPAWRPKMILIKSFRPTNVTQHLSIDPSTMVEWVMLSEKRRCPLIIQHEVQWWKHVQHVDTRHIWHVWGSTVESGHPS